jgi:hypothetical protein
MGAPDWRGNVPGKPMSSQNVSDVVAWLAAQRISLVTCRQMLPSEVWYRVRIHAPSGRTTPRARFSDEAIRRE